MCATVLSVSTWLPWLTSGGRHVSAIGGPLIAAGFGVGQSIMLLASVLLVTGAMIARGLSARPASVAALVISVLIGVLIVSYYRGNVVSPVAAGYGLYIGAVGAVGAVGCSGWALVSTLMNPSLSAGGRGSTPG